MYCRGCKALYNEMQALRAESAIKTANAIRAAADECEGMLEEWGANKEHRELWKLVRAQMRMRANKIESGEVKP
jgi:Flp pilus assembly CpaF family ATPase